MNSVLAVCLSPTFQRILVFKKFCENEVNRSKKTLELVSGKGINVSRVLNNLGRPCMNLIQLGGCRVEEFLEMCRKEGLDVKYLPVDAGIRTCTTIVNEDGHTSTELVEEAFPVGGADSDKFFNLFRQELPGHSAVVVSGTKAAGFSPDLYPSIVRECCRSGKMTVLDIKGGELISCLKEHPTIIKPNVGELFSTFFPAEVFPGADDPGMEEAVEEIIRKIWERYKTKSVITRGRFSTLVFDGKDFIKVENKMEHPVVNTIGCGDTLTAAMLHRFMDGASLEESVGFGMECAEKKASKVGQGLL